MPLHGQSSDHAMSSCHHWGEGACRARNGTPFTIIRHRKQPKLNGALYKYLSRGYYDTSIGNERETMWLRVGKEPPNTQI
jgi:hypothetical protein